MNDRILCVEKYPDIPGHVGQTVVWDGRRKATSTDGRYWLVRRNGLFRRWQWLPHRGQFISLYPVAD
jgi:hypothetical protein